MSRPKASNPALGGLFLVLTALFTGIAYTAYAARVWVVVFAAGVLALWLASMAFRGLRR